MKRTYITAIAVTVILSGGGAALAQGQHGHGQQPSGKSGMMDGGMMPMHRNMMQGAGMMQGGGMMQGKGLMGPQFRALMDANGDGKVEPAEARAQLQKLLQENDTDSDGTLSLSEFEVLHSRLIRETMVDRFQHLDNDGDGAITAEEYRERYGYYFTIFWKTDAPGSPNTVRLEYTQANTGATVHVKATHIWFRLI